MDASGQNYSVYPGTMRELVAEGARFDLDAYRTTRADQRATARVEVA
jgi:hypothetical protein